MRILRLAAALLAVALPSAAAAQSPDSVFLRPGDMIHLAVWRQAEFTGDFRVTPEGTIEHPLLSEVSVVGVPRSVIRDRLRAVLLRYDRDPSFVFDFLYRVGVGGEVRVPNLYNLPPETTLAQAVAAAGGANEFGRLDQVHVLREGREIVVNLQNPDPSVAEMRIHSGDQLRVPRRLSVFRDWIAPVSAVLGAIAAGITVFRR
jgi:polysaccharide export outer membrane protein